MNEYQKILKKLFLLRSNDRSLKDIFLLNEHLMNPIKNFKSIHIAGTNGKGSCALKLYKGFLLSGYKTALYTSPHISSFSERIIVNDKMISKYETLKILKKIFFLQKKLKLNLNFFDITTLLAFYYFSLKKVDFAIIEVGLGGRLDATNIITPILSIITSINFDHTNDLGDTLDKIAFEKGGIIKKNIPCVIGQSANLCPIINKAKIQNSPLFLADDNKIFYDDKNNEIVKLCYKILKKNYNLSSAAIKKSYLFRPEARFQVLKGLGPKAIILDAAHNPDGFNKLKDALKLFFPKEKIRVILGFSKNKDVYSSLKILTSIPSLNFIHIVKANYFKSLSISEIKKQLIRINFLNFKEEKNIATCVTEAIEKAKSEKEILLVVGSFYILKDIKKSFRDL